MTSCVDWQYVPIHPVEKMWRGNYQKRPIPWRKEQLGSFPSYKDFAWPPPQKKEGDFTDILLWGAGVHLTVLVRSYKTANESFFHQEDSIWAGSGEVQGTCGITSECYHEGSKDNT